VTLLEVKNLVTEFETSGGTVRAVDGLDLHVEKGEALGIVGESGCGKSVTSLSILRLIPSPPGRIAGQVRFEDRDLLKVDKNDMRAIRGNRISMIFQEPMSSLNPVLKIGRQIAEPLMVHRGMSEHNATREAVQLLQLVQIPEAQRRVNEYPFQMSGGMRQRVMIAMAIACHPSLLIADEPTTALDVTIQAQILDLLGELRRELGMAMILITHDFGVVAEIADRIVVMYAGRKVEEAGVAELFANPRHPYTRALMASMPRLGSSLAGERRRLNEIAGVVPSLHGAFQGCSFAERCARAQDRCRATTPTLTSVDATAHQVACHRHMEAA
jgi:peptide/nickel transport system ATP-binding protein